MSDFFQGWDLSIIAAIASAVAAISSVIVSCVFSSAQKKQSDNAKKIAVFDSRFEIYQCFMQLFKYADYIVQDSANQDSHTQQLNYLSVLDRITDDHDFLNGRSYRAAHNHLCHEVMSGGEKGHQADRDLYYLDEDVHNKIVSLKIRSLSTIEKGKFFFERQLIPLLVAYVSELLEYVDVFHKGTALERVRDSTALLKAIDAVKKKCVTDKMEQELSVQ